MIALIILAVVLVVLAVTGGIAVVSGQSERSQEIMRERMMKEVRK